MSTPTALPTRIEPSRGESLESFVRRLATVNHVPPQWILGQSLKTVMRTRSPAVFDRLSALSGIPQDRLIAMQTRLLHGMGHYKAVGHGQTVGRCPRCPETDPAPVLLHLPITFMCTRCRSLLQTTGEQSEAITLSPATLTIQREMLRCAAQNDPRTPEIKALRELQRLARKAQHLPPHAWPQISSDAARLLPGSEIPAIVKPNQPSSLSNHPGTVALLAITLWRYAIYRSTPAGRVFRITPLDATGRHQLAAYNTIHNNADRLDAAYGHDLSTLRDPVSCYFAVCLLAAGRPWTGPLRPASPGYDDLARAEFVTTMISPRPPTDHSR